MGRMPDLLRTGAAAAAGLLLAVIANGTAAAEDPEPPPVPFSASDMGEDGCTVFETSGEARWSTADFGPTGHRIDVSGASFALATPGAPGYCLPVIPADRQVEFTAFADGAVVDEHVEPIDRAASSSEYRFALTTPMAVDRVTVAVCQERRADGSTWADRCGGTVTVQPDPLDPEAPQPYSYEFVLPDACYKAVVDATVQWIGSRVRVEGVATTELASPDHACDPVEPPWEEYRVVFAAHHNDWAMEEIQVPFQPVETGGEFSLLLPGDPEETAAVHYLTAGVCAFDSEGGGLGCLENSRQLFEPEAEEDYCTFTYAVTADWGNGFMGTIDITPLVEPLHDWKVVITLGDDRWITSAWNAEWSQVGDTVTATNTSWNGIIPVGGTVTVGFVASGPSNPPPTVEVYGNGRPCTAA